MVSFALISTTNNPSHGWNILQNSQLDIGKAWNPIPSLVKIPLISNQNHTAW
jgi:hypothetical protein